jgi:3'-phosphoadenosine 5'-phosphosulfate sulfotransferase (PAPS reductase)/FAD synthetase
MYYIMSLSGGVSSAVAADLAIKRYGRKKVYLWFADTSFEDADLYRFVDDCMGRWGGKLHTYCDGRTPEQVAEDKRLIPNQKIAPCTHVLKIAPFTKWLWRVPRPVTVLLGLSWSEMHRIDQRRFWSKRTGKWKPPTGYQSKIPGVYEDFPLLWKPIVYHPFQYVEQEMNIPIPRLYKIGFDHNNCKGECFRQSIANWMLLRDERPKEFLRKAHWELKQQGELKTEYSIIRDQRNGKTRPLPLMALIERKRVRQQAGDNQQMSMFEDNSNCICEI